MSKLLILALFCSILYYSNAFGKIRSNKIQTEATYCQKPRKISPFDSVRASSQIGTGADFLFRNNLIGKSPIVNTNTEKWCYDHFERSLRNNKNGLYLEKTYLSSGGAGPILLVTRTEPVVASWEFQRLTPNENIYVIKFTVEQRFAPAYTYALTLNSDNSVGISAYVEGNDLQKWRVE